MTPSPSRLPTVAIVGRPNVGKSTLFNRLVGWRRAIVGDEPGITRDRLYGEAEWNGRLIRVIDTGGIVPQNKDEMPSEIYRQARVAMAEADAIIMIVDGRTELASTDMELARLLLRSGKPLFLAVNKIDSPAMDASAENFRRLGIRNLYPISAEHSNGVAELLEAVLAEAPSPAAREARSDSEVDAARMVFDEPESRRKSRKHRAQNRAQDRVNDRAAKVAPMGGELSPGERDLGDSPPYPAGSGAEDKIPAEIKVAIIGRPNVGKSTLLNRLTGTDRSIVSKVAGTTRDAVDEVLERHGKTYRFIDTAGIRRKGKTHLLAEKLSVVMARKHLESADIALLMVDASEGVTALDSTIGGYAHESGRSVIVVINKWDLVMGPAMVARKEAGGSPRPHRGEHRARPADQRLYEEQVRRALKFLNYAPIVFISASAGKSADKIFPLLETVAQQRWKRISTGEMNRFLKRVDLERASVPANKQVRVFYLTQAHVAPPTFILFTDRDVKLHFSYQRFLENQIRKAFGFEGTPIWIKTRSRDS